MGFDVTTNAAADGISQSALKIDILAEGILVHGVDVRKVPAEGLWYVPLILGWTILPNVFPRYGLYVVSACLFLCALLVLLHQRFGGAVPAAWALRLTGQGRDAAVVMNLACTEQGWAKVLLSEVQQLHFCGPIGDRRVQWVLKNGEVIEQRTTQWLAGHWLSFEPTIKAWLERANEPGLAAIPVWSLPLAKALELRKFWTFQRCQRAETGIYWLVSGNASKPPIAYQDRRGRDFPSPGPWRCCVLALVVLGCAITRTFFGGVPMTFMAVGLVLVITWLQVQRRNAFEVPEPVDTGFPLIEYSGGMLIFQLDFSTDAKRVAVQIDRLQQVQLQRIPGAMQQDAWRLQITMQTGLVLSQAINAPPLTPGSRGRSWLVPLLQHWLGSHRVRVDDGWEASSH